MVRGENQRPARTERKCVLTTWNSGDALGEYLAGCDDRIREQSSRTSSTMWVERMTVRRQKQRRLRKRLRSAGAGPAVGSSTIIRRGGRASCGDPDALLHADRISFMPPE
jgi:hypothetical protein